MQNIKLEAETREPISNGKLNTLRKEGWIPAVLYGTDKAASKNKKGSSNVLLKVNEKNFLKTVGSHKSMIVELNWGSQNANVVIKELQRDPVSRKFIHIDFQKISMTEKLEVMVPIHTVGEAPGVKLAGGILEMITRELKVLCLPKDIPQAVNVDISHLEIGKGLSVKDIAAIPGVEILSDQNLLVVNIVAPAAEEVAPAAATPTGPAEPEVIAKGKKPEEGEAAAGAAPAAGKAEKGAPAATKEKAAPAK